MPPRPAGFKILAIDDDHVQAADFNMLFVVWQRRTLQPAVRAVVASLKRHAAKHPEGIGSMQVLEESSTLPEPETRNLFPEVLGATRAAPGALSGSRATRHRLRLMHQPSETRDGAAWLRDVARRMKAQG